MGPCTFRQLGYTQRLRERSLCRTLFWIIRIGFIAGIIARVLSPGPNELVILTTALGIAGAFVATFGQTIGWYQLDQGAGLIGATVGAAARAVHLEPALWPIAFLGNPHGPQRAAAPLVLGSGRTVSPEQRSNLTAAALEHTL
jgi:uncharacterized membrane protein YeaQ/YmgE (transglycosylase-associated protein family)